MKTKTKDFTARDYAKIVEWSDEDRCFIGSAPPLIGQCCHGDDEATVMRELCQIVDEHVAIHKEDGRPLPEPREYSGKFILRIDPVLHRLLGARADREGESLNSFITKQLQRAK
jgi:predicted HicB family RNase H-like nuclease